MNWPLSNYGVRSVCVVNDLIPFRIVETNDLDSRTRYFKALSNAIEKADVIICISRATESDLHDLFPRTLGKSIVIHIGHAYENTSTLDLISSSIMPSTATILMVGTVEPRKNHAVILKALPLVLSALAPRRVRLLIAGDSYNIGFLEAQLSQARAAGAIVEFLDYVSESTLQEAYTSASVVAFPSLWEGFGIPILEALVLGCPVIASFVASHPEVGADLVDYCDPYSPDDVANGLIRVLQRPRVETDSRRALGIAWAKKFSWLDAAKRYEEILTVQDIANNKESCSYVVQHQARDLLNTIDIRFSSCAVIKASQVVSSDAGSIKLRAEIDRLGTGSCIILVVDAGESALGVTVNLLPGLSANATLLIRLPENSTSPQLELANFVSLSINKVPINILGAVKISQGMVSHVLADLCICDDSDLAQAFVNARQFIAPAKICTPSNSEREWFGGLVEWITASCPPIDMASAVLAGKMLRNNPQLKFGVHILIFVDCVSLLPEIKACISGNKFGTFTICCNAGPQVSGVLILENIRSQIILMREASRVIYVQGRNKIDNAIEYILAEGGQIDRVVKELKMSKDMRFQNYESIEAAISKIAKDIEFQNFRDRYDEWLRQVSVFAVTGRLANNGKNQLTLDSYLKRTNGVLDNLTFGRDIKTYDYLSRVAYTKLKNPPFIKVSSLQTALGDFAHFSMPASGAELAGIKEMSETVSACLCEKPWADVQQAWHTNSLEQVFRLHKIKHFDFVIYAGESWIPDRMDAREIDDELMSIIVRSSANIIIAGGEFEPVSESGLYVTGPVLTCSPVIAASNAGLILPSRAYESTSSMCRAVFRFLAEGLPIIVPLELRPDIQALFTDIPMDSFHFYEDLDQALAWRHFAANYERGQSWLSERLADFQLKDRVLLDDLRLNLGGIVHAVVEQGDVESYRRAIIEANWDQGYLSLCCQETIDGFQKGIALGLRTDQDFWVSARHLSANSFKIIKDNFNSLIYKAFDSDKIS